MAAIPAEFEDLLTPAGRRVLAGSADVCGALADPRRRFVSMTGMIAKSKAEALRKVLESKLRPLLSEMAMPIPPETIWEMTHNYEEWLPKTVRVKTAYLEKKRAKAYLMAEEIGLIRLLKSVSFVHFAGAIAGKTLDKRGGQQVLCYGPGDYAGPHNDHHPQDAKAAKGYLDIHVSLVGPGVLNQYLIYAKSGHFTEMAPVHETGTITVYRLPFWHLTTPLQPKPKREAEARRWVLLGTFLFQQ
jgi:hypothetical protein